MRLSALTEIEQLCGHMRQKVGGHRQKACGRCCLMGAAFLALPSSAQHVAALPGKSSLLSVKKGHEDISQDWDQGSLTVTLQVLGCPYGLSAWSEAAD